MSQHDMVIENQGFAATRADINAAFAALATNNSGATEPATTYAFQPWADTTADRLKIRNAGNDAWISVLVLSTGAPVSGVSAGLITASGLTQATNRLLGRSTGGTGAVEELSLAATLELVAGALGVKDASLTAGKLNGAQSGSAPIYGVRAWCVFDGTLTGSNAPIQGGNVASINRTGTGVYTVTLIDAMSDANYSVAATCTQGATGYIATVSGMTTSTFVVRVFGQAGTAQDAVSVHLNVVR